eukprot:2179013-Ditylum_brightwellii.AAC.1
MHTTSAQTTNCTTHNNRNNAHPQQLQQRSPTTTATTLAHKSFPAFLLRALKTETVSTQQSATWH